MVVKRFETKAGLVGCGIVPLLENNFVLFFPRVLEVGGKLMPDRKDSVW